MPTEQVWRETVLVLKFKCLTTNTNQSFWNQTNLMSTNDIPTCSGNVKVTSPLDRTRLKPPQSEVTTSCLKIVLLYIINTIQWRIQDFSKGGDFCKRGAIIHCLITKICELGACFLYFSYIYVSSKWGGGD